MSSTTASFTRWVGRSLGFALIYLGVAYLANLTPLASAPDVVYVIVVAAVTVIAVAVLARMVTASAPPAPAPEPAWEDPHDHWKS